MYIGKSSASGDEQEQARDAEPREVWPERRDLRGERAPRGRAGGEREQHLCSREATWHT